MSLCELKKSGAANPKCLCGDCNCGVLVAACNMFRNKSIWRRVCIWSAVTASALILAFVKCRPGEPVVSDEVSVRVRVVDRIAGLLVRHFRVRWTVQRVGGGMGNAEWYSVAVNDGEFKCDIRRGDSLVSLIAAEGYFPLKGFERVEVSTSNGVAFAERVVHLTPAIRVDGIVLDSTNGSPVSAAVVAPLQFWEPLIREDKSRGVMSDANGRFSIDGVNPTLGLAVSADGYLSRYVYFHSNEHLTDGTVLAPDVEGPLVGVTKVISVSIQREYKR